jgi:hypothetical protein
MSGDRGGSRRSALPACIILLGISFAVIGALWSWRDYVAASVVALATLMGISGYRMGATKALGLAGGIPLAFHFAPTVSAWVGSLWGRFLGAPDPSLRIGIFCVVVLGMIVGVAVCAYYIFRFFVADRPFMEASNRWLGTGLAVTYSFMLSLLFLGGILVVERTVARQARGSLMLAPGTMQAHLFDKLLDTAERTRNSTIGPYVKQWNPFNHVPLLAQLEQSIGGGPNPFSARSRMASSQVAEDILQEITGGSNLLSNPSSRFNASQQFDQNMTRALMRSRSVRELFDRSE